MPSNRDDYPLIQFAAPQIAEKADARKQSTDSSANMAARRDLTRYYRLLEEARPAFTRNQALLLVDALNGTTFEPAMQAARLLWAEVEGKPDPLFEKYDVEKVGLVERLQNLSVAEALAVADAVERFWNDPGASVEGVGLCGPSEVRN